MFYFCFHSEAEIQDTLRTCFAALGSEDAKNSMLMLIDEACPRPEMDTKKCNLRDAASCLADIRVTYTEVKGCGTKKEETEVLEINEEICK